MPLARVAILTGVALLLAACAAGAGAGGDTVHDAAHDAAHDVGADDARLPWGPYPAAPDGAGALLHVAPGGGEGAPDGSAARPFRTIGAAIAAAAPGTTILVAAATYDESLRIERAPLAIVGARDPVSGEPAVFLRPPPSADTAGGVFVLGPGADPPESVALTGLVVQGAGTAGIWVSGQGLHVEACRVEGARAVTPQDGSDPVYGFGILAMDGARVAVRESAVIGCDGPGILLSESTGSVTGSRFERNGRGGIRLEGCTAAPVRVEGNAVLGNAELGIAVLGSQAEVLGNDVRGTTAFGTFAGADGILVGALTGPAGAALAGATARVEGNTVRDSARAGILFGAGAGGAVRDNEVSGNDYGGIYLQGDAGERGPELDVSANVVRDNRYVGVAAKGGVSVRLHGNDVGATRPGPTFVDGAVVSVGYGIGVFAGALADVRGSRLGPFASDGAAQLAHVLVDSAAAGTVVACDRQPDGSPVSCNRAAEDGATIVIAVQHQRPEDVTVDNPGATVERYGADERPYTLAPAMTASFPTDSRSHAR